MCCRYWNNYSLPIALPTLLYGSGKFALNVNKEIIRLTSRYLKASKRFIQPSFRPTSFVFIFYFSFLSTHLYFLLVLLLHRPYCKWLYLIWVLCLSFTVLGITFYISCFIVSFIVSACKDPCIYIYIWYIYIYIYINIYIKYMLIYIYIYIY